MKLVKDFSSGFYSAFEGMKFLFSHGALIKIAIIPWLINFVLFIAMAWNLIENIDSLIDLIVTKPETWYLLILYYCFMVLVFLLIFIVATFALCLIGNLIASPFHEWMTEKTKAILLGKTEDRPFSWKALLIETKRIAGTQVKKLLLLLILEIAVLMLVLIPVIGTVMSAGLTLILLAFQFLDFPLEVERLNFSQQVRSFLSFPMAWFGFGAGISLLLLIPIVNLSVLPGGVVGASLLYYKRMDPGSRFTRPG